MADEDQDDKLAAVRPKLVETKERWAEEGRKLTGHQTRPETDRLPPGQHLVKNWPVLDLGVQPDITRQKWHLRIDGLVESRVVWDWDGLMAQPQTDDVSDMHCVTTWSRYDNRWQGVRLSHALSLAKPKPNANFATLHGYDGYTTNVSLSALLGDDVMLVHTWEGKPITREHGGPVRMLIPKLYLWKSAKWLCRIELTSEDRPGFWEERGYHDHGDPWLEERYS